jgi:hypothetical protein
LTSVPSSTVDAAPRTTPKMSASTGLTMAIGAGRASGRRAVRRITASISRSM